MNQNVHVCIEGTKFLKAAVGLIEMAGNYYLPGNYVAIDLWNILMMFN